MLCMTSLSTLQAAYAKELKTVRRIRAGEPNRAFMHGTSSSLWWLLFMNLTTTRRSNPEPFQTDCA